jgi:hypothetical protein
MPLLFAGAVAACRVAPETRNCVLNPPILSVASCVIRYLNSPSCLPLAVI